MTRIRSVKPELFKHEELFEAEIKTKLPLRLAYIGLWTTADREGRFRWRPRQLKIEIFPYDEKIDFESILEALVIFGFIQKYKVEGKYYGFIPTWHKHQRVNNRESASILPAPENGEIISSLTREARVVHASTTSLQHTSGEMEGKGKEGEKEGKGNSAELRASNDDAASALPVVSIPLNTGEEYPISENQVAEWQSLYPAVDILQTLRAIRGWNLSHPKKRKTKSGILSHINTWLAKAQNTSTQNRSPPHKFSNSLSEQNARAAEQWIRESESKIIDAEVVE